MGQKKGCSLCRVINGLFSLAMCGLVGFGIWYALGSPDGDDLANFEFPDFGDFAGVLDNFTDFEGGFNTDPFIGDNTTTNWDNGGGNNGLELELVNALDDTWQDEFVAAVSDWENGDPDALTLSTSQADVDNACTPIKGVMKVCNGNYGETGWLGINEIVSTTNSGIIQNSVAKMNEFYLNQADDIERQYTMCHEIGHGFGLPHTDENFYNADLGNCLDYTISPKNNLHPSETNYKRLVSLYGTTTRRYLIGKGRSSSNVRTPGSLSSNVLSTYDEAIKEIEGEMLSIKDATQSSSGWRLLETHAGGSRYTRDLGEGYTLTVHALHPIQK
jgi:hypothetical protein